MKLTNVLVI